MSLAIEAENIITNHVGYAMAAAAIPVPLADIAAVTLVQLDMVKALSAEFDVDYDQSSGNALLAALAGASAARLGARPSGKSNSSTAGISANHLLRASRLARFWRTIGMPRASSRPRCPATSPTPPRPVTI